MSHYKSNSSRSLRGVRTTKAAERRGNLPAYSPGVPFIRSLRSLAEWCEVPIPTKCRNRDGNLIAHLPKVC